MTQNESAPSNMTPSDMTPSNMTPSNMSHSEMTALGTILCRVPVIATIAVVMLWPGVTQGQWVTPPASGTHVQYHTFESAAAATTVSFHVYLPPAYEAQPCRDFPVLYWLHGAGAGIGGIAPLSTWFNNAIGAGLIPPMLVVFPNGMNFSMWSDSHDGVVPMESVVIDDLVPAIDAMFRTIASREGRIVEGFSMGGYGAGRLGFKHHELFAGVSMLGAGPLQLDFLDEPPGSTIPRRVRLQIYQQVWGSDPDLFLAQSPWMLAEQNLEAIISAGMKLRLAVGQDDFVVPANLDFQSHLTELGIPHDFYFPAGIDHSPLQLLIAIGAENWDFYRELFDGFCGCAGDLNGDGVVDGADLGLLLSKWGPCAACFADLNGDGVVDGADLGILLSVWTLTRAP